MCSSGVYRVSRSVLSIILLLVFLAVGCAEQGPRIEVPDRLFEVPSFSLTNCDNQTISNDDLKGNVWVVDFIFTRCGGPCPLMTQRLKSVQDALRENGLLAPEAKVRLVSISVDPGYDSPEVLSEYAQTWGIDLGSWYLLTGPEKETLELIREGFKITATRQGSGTEDMAAMPSIVHSTNFLLVDQEGWVTRIFHLDDEGLRDKMVQAVEALL